MSPLPPEKKRCKLAYLLAATVSGALPEAVLQCRYKTWYSMEPVRGEEVGIPAPTHATLTEVVKRVERGEIETHPRNVETL